MRTRKAAATLACLLTLLVLAPASALALSKVCEEAFLAGETDAPPGKKAEQYSLCLDSGQPDDVARAMMHYNRGNMRRLLGQPEQALEDYGAAIRLNKPMLHEVYNNRGALLLELGRFEAAIKDFDQAIALKPDEVFAFCNRGNAYSRLGQLRRALEDYDQAVRIDPNYFLAQGGRGAVHLELGQHQLAIADFDRALLLQPDDYLVLFNRAEARARLGQFKAAIADFRQAIQRKPDFAPAFNGLAWLLATSRDKTVQDGKMAVEAANTAVALKRSHAHLDTLAAALARADRYAEAVKIQEEALKLLPAAAKPETRREYEARLVLYQADKPYTEPKRTQL